MVRPIRAVVSDANVRESPAPRSRAVPPTRARKSIVMMAKTPPRKRVVPRRAMESSPRRVAAGLAAVAQVAGASSGPVDQNAPELKRREKSRSTPVVADVLDSSEESSDGSERPHFLQLPAPPNVDRRVPEKEMPEAIASQDRIVKRAEKVIRPFDPKLGVEDWISQFEEKTAGLSGEIVLQIFSDKLDAGPCFSWFNARRREGKCLSVRGWLSLLTSSFATDPLQRKHELRSRKQQEGEDASEFVRDIDTLCIRYLPTMTMLDKIGHISDNVHPKYAITFAMLSAHDRTLADVELSLRTAMKLSAVSDRRSGTPTFPMGSSPKHAEKNVSFAYSCGQESESETDPTLGVCRECGKPGHRTANCWQQLARNGTFCTICKKRNHVAENCRFAK